VGRRHDRRLTGFQITRRESIVYLIAQLSQSDWVGIIVAAVPVAGGIVWWMSAMYSRVDANATSTEGLKKTLEIYAEHNRSDHQEIWRAFTQHRKATQDTANELWRAVHIHGNQLVEHGTRLEHTESRVSCLEDATELKGK